MAFQKKDVAVRLKHLGVTPRLIQFHTEEGLVVPDIANPTGTGGVRIYSAENLGDEVIVKRCADVGLALVSIHKVMKKVRETSFRRKYFAPGARVIQINEPNTANMKVFPIYHQPAEVPQMRFDLTGFETVLVLNLDKDLDSVKA